MKKIFFTLTILSLACCQFLFAQNGAKAAPPPSGSFTVGERLTYNISFSNFNVAAYAETYVVSAGKYGAHDAVYLQGKIKTSDLVNAAFFRVDENRQTLVDAGTGLPLFCKKIFDENGIPREKSFDYKDSATGYDWLSAIYHLRFATANTGSITIQEGDDIIQATYRPIGKAHSKTAGGEFDTDVIEVQNPTFPGLQIYFSDDEQRLPVVLTYKNPKGTFRAELASIQDLAPEPVAAATPKPQSTPVAVSTPRPRPTPPPYINNQPLSADLPFTLGETLTYKLTRTGAATSFGTMAVQAKERRQFNGRDSLLLTTTIQQVTDSSSIFSPGDIIRSYVDPESLLPMRTEIVFRGALSPFNQTLSFDQATGKVSDNRAAMVDVPVGTHDILSLAYAVRSFNLKDVKPGKGPGTDTRVALFTSDGPVILTILPQPEETIDYQGKKVLTQVVFTNVGQTTVKLWLSKEADRLPLRLNIVSPTFSFFADLISVAQNPPGEAAAGVTEFAPGIPGISPQTMPNPIPANPIDGSTIKKP
jgi:hypothetical protein